MYTKYYITYGKNMTSIWLKKHINVFLRMKDGIPLEGYGTNGELRMVNSKRINHIDTGITIMNERVLNVLFNQRPISTGQHFYADGHPKSVFEVEYFMDRHDNQLTSLTDNEGVVVKAVGSDELFKFDKTYLVIAKE